MVGIGLREVDVHGFFSRYNQRFAGQIVEGRFAGKMHYLFSTDHARDNKVIKCERNLKRLLKGFKNIQLAIMERIHASVFDQSSQLPGMRKVDSRNEFSRRLTQRF